MVPANVLQILRDGTAKLFLVSYVCMNIYITYLKMHIIPYTVEGIFQGVKFSKCKFGFNLLHYDK